MRIIISADLQAALPNFRVVAYTMKVNNASTMPVLDLLLKTQEEHQNICDLKDVVKLPKLLPARDGYKKLGKDPSRYRLATEALIRRVIRKIPLYRLGDLIDLGNILSIMTLRSICVVDLDKICGDVVIRIGTKQDSFEAINRGRLNIENMPVYTDLSGPFGTPTSDTPRTAITDGTRRILIMMISFHPDELETDEKTLIRLYAQYAQATNITKVS